MIHTHAKSEIFLPLMDDWLFRPLLYIHDLSDPNLQQLVSDLNKQKYYIQAGSIFRYLDSAYTNDAKYAFEVTRLTKNNVVLLIAHLLADQTLCFSSQAQLSFIYFL